MSIKSILSGLEAIHKEFQELEAKAHMRQAERAMQKRQRWHLEDVAGSNGGSFFEAIAEVTSANHKELYMLFVTEPETFGRRLRELADVYLDDMAMRIAGREVDRD